jgi:hypothetical protein
MVRVAVWVDAESELICGYASLPGEDLVGSASSFAVLASAIEDQLSSVLAGGSGMEVGYLHLGCMRQPVRRSVLQQALARASVVG